MQKKKLMYGLIGVGVLVLTLIALLIYTTMEKNHAFAILEEDKAILEDEYNNLSSDLDSLTQDNYRVTLNNDSLFFLLEQEHLKIEQLKDQLKNVNASNAAEIRRYKKQLATMREVLKSYVKQIDELNARNAELEAENAEIRQTNRSTTKTLNQVKAKAEELQNTVELASALVATGFEVTPQTKSGRKTARSRRTKSVKVCFTIARNITADPGEKTLYLRIMKPNGEVANGNTGTFTFEDNQVAYTAKKVIKYGGEEVQECIFWEINELITEGEYSYFLFADGRNIGEGRFNLK